MLVLEIRHAPNAAPPAALPRQGANVQQVTAIAPLRCHGRHAAGRAPRVTTSAINARAQAGALRTECSRAHDTLRGTWPHRGAAHALSPAHARALWRLCTEQEPQAAHRTGAKLGGEAGRHSQGAMSTSTLPRSSPKPRRRSPTRPLPRVPLLLPAWCIIYPSPAHPLYQCSAIGGLRAAYWSSDARRNPEELQTCAVRPGVACTFHSGRFLFVRHGREAIKRWWMLQLQQCHRGDAECCIKILSMTESCIQPPLAFPPISPILRLRAVVARLSRQAAVVA